MTEKSDAPGPSAPRLLLDKEIQEGMAKTLGLLRTIICENHVSIDEAQSAGEQQTTSPDDPKDTADSLVSSWRIIGDPSTPGDAARDQLTRVKTGVEKLSKSPIFAEPSEARELFGQSFHYLLKVLDNISRADSYRQETAARKTQDHQLRARPARQNLTAPSTATADDSPL